MRFSNAVHDLITTAAQDGGMDAQHGSTAHGAAEGEGATRYAAFLLRVWRSDGEAGDGWRMVLGEVGTEERHGFTEWEALVQHICDSLMAGFES